MNIAGGMFKGVVLCGALVALIFLSVKTMPQHSFLSSLGLLNSSPISVIPLDFNVSSAFVASGGMPRHTTLSSFDMAQDKLSNAKVSFSEENPVVFSEFIAPVENATSTIQVALAVPIVSSTEVVVSSTLPVDVIPTLVVGSTSTPETQVFTASMATPVDMKIEPALCVGTSSTLAVSLPNPLSRVVRINELAWMGTTGSSTSSDKAQDKSLTTGSYTDEWIELYNTSSSSISLAGAQLVASSSKSLFSVRFGDGDSIASNGYFLLERTNDSSVPNIIADKIYTGALNDDEEVVELFDAGCNSLDRVDFKKDFPLVSTNIDRRSMELKPDTTFGLYEGNVDAVSGIFGSPKRENSYHIMEIASSTIETVVSSTEIVGVVPQIGSVSSTFSIVINEILFNGERSDKGKEFVELYNPSDIEQNLKGWSLRLLKTGATSTTSLVTFGDSSDDHTIIPQHGFFLVGLNSYDAMNFNGVVADIRRSGVLPNGEDEASVLLLDSNKNEIDRIVYTAQPITKEGQSLERSGVDIFVVKDTPSPKNSLYPTP